MISDRRDVAYRTGLNVTPVLLCLIIASSSPAKSEPSLSPTIRAVPGASAPVSRVRYAHHAASRVAVAGSWDQWRGRIAIDQEEGLWMWDAGKLALPLGRYEFKFLVDGDYEPGENRILYVNAEGKLRRPPQIIRSATLEEPGRVTVRFVRRMPLDKDWTFRLQPPATVQNVVPIERAAGEAERGYRLEGDTVEFVFESGVYGVELGSGDHVEVAGNFNDWQTGARDWRMRAEDDGTHRLAIPLANLSPPDGEDELQFKFVVNGSQWQTVPPDAPNAAPDGRGHTNLRLDPEDQEGVDGVTVVVDPPLAQTNSYLLLVEGAAGETAWAPVALGDALLNRWRSAKPLGAAVDHDDNRTTFRIFAPRAREVQLKVVEGAAQEEHAMSRDPIDGVWEVTLPGDRTSIHYAYSVKGPPGPGEGFDPLARVGDPYARAVAHARGNTILVDPAATNEWFTGWTDRDYRPPAWEDLVIYETHVRHFTRDASSGVPGALRGKFAGLPATVGTGTGLDHLKELGVNAIEVMPIAEFDNGEDEYNWGYATAFFFAPEASYGRAPREGSQYYEFKQMVNDLHEQGFAVILDVVYNHAGHPNVFQLTDRPYFFRLRPDLGYMNFSGVGNDFRTEAPMMRRLIIDNVLYFMKEHHVDGFRFDLAELIDLETLMELRDASREVNPDVILISEPWSFRGNHKQQLTGTGWSAWNDDFRNAVKDFVIDGADRGQLMEVIAGSVDSWAANPLQSVNYLESHDDMALADELSSAPGHDGRKLHDADIRRNRVAATILFTSLGIPMLAEGQEFLRSKHGIRNTYDRGDAVNALRWGDRDRPGAKETLDYYRGLIALRQGDEGRAFRVPGKPDADYYRFIEPPEPRALGYFVNAGGQRKGGRFLVLANAAETPTEFTFALPEGPWRMVGDGAEVRPEGWDDGVLQDEDGPVTVTVPAMTGYVYMRR